MTRTVRLTTDERETLRDARRIVARLTKLAVALKRKGNFIRLDQRIGGHLVDLQTQINTAICTTGGSQY